MIVCVRAHVRDRHSKRDYNEFQNVFFFSVISDNCLPQTREQNPPDKFPIVGY